MAKRIEKVVITHSPDDGKSVDTTLYVSKDEDINKMVLYDEDGFEILNSSLDFMFKLADYICGVRDDNDTKITRNVEAEFQEVLNNKP